MSLKSGGLTRAAVLRLPKEVSAPGWLPFVQMDDVAAAIGRATANGGKVQSRRSLRNAVSAALLAVALAAGCAF